MFYESNSESNLSERLLKQKFMKTEL